MVMPPFFYFGTSVQAFFLGHHGGDVVSWDCGIRG